MADHHHPKMKKSTRGKQKIEMKKIKETSNRQVAFTKRRSGLLKKAGELAVICGADVAVVALSERENPFSFGNPSADVVINRFLSGSSNNNNNTDNKKTCPNNSSSSYPLVHELNKQYEEAVQELEEEKKKGVEIEKGGENDLFLWDLPMENMSLEDLEEYKESLIKMRQTVVARVNQLMMIEGQATNKFFSSNNPRVVVPVTAAAGYQNLVNENEDCSSSSSTTTPHLQQQQQQQQQ